MLNHNERRPDHFMSAYSISAPFSSDYIGIFELGY